jgi:hypothetical protein
VPIEEPAHVSTEIPVEQVVLPELKNELFCPLFNTLKPHPKNSPDSQQQPIMQLQDRKTNSSHTPKPTEISNEVEARNYEEGSDTRCPTNIQCSR